MIRQTDRKENHRVNINAGNGIDFGDRLVVSPSEFASLLGRSATFGYRRIYDGSVKVITGHGRMMIPLQEVERFLASAAVYNGAKHKRSGGRSNGK